MWVDTSSYPATEFNSVLDYEDVLPRFDAIDGDKLGKGRMKVLFRHEGVQNSLGLSLLQKYSKLRPGERLTEIRSPASLLYFELVQEPFVWRVDTPHQKLMPVEFAMESIPMDWNDTAIQGFLENFGTPLNELDAENIFGLCQYLGDGYPEHVEFTVDRTNVNSHPDEVEIPSAANVRETAWFFTDDFTKRGCDCNCFANAAYNHSHGYTSSA